MKVFHDDDPSPCATIGYGWEKPQFYVDWMFGEKEAAGMAGSRLEPMQPQGPRAEMILQMTRSVLLGKPDIVEKIKARYAAFKRVCDG